LICGTYSFDLTFVFSADSLNLFSAIHSWKPSGHKALSFFYDSIVVASFTEVDGVLSGDISLRFDEVNIHWVLPASIKAFMLISFDLLLFFCSRDPVLDERLLALLTVVGGPT
jgi:hypothetical protein